MGTPERQDPRSEAMSESLPGVHLTVSENKRGNSWRTEYVAARPVRRAQFSTNTTLGQVTIPHPTFI
jgi:hypothetical protein